MFEVNLVPDVKAEMLKTQKMRNIVVFVCIIVVAVAAGIIAILGGVKAGQDIAMSSQDSQIETLSAKVNSFDDLNELLAIQGQLNGLQAIAEEKMLFTRIFSVINVLLPTNGDEISLSELSVDVENSTLQFDAQADAKIEPLIDYRVLDAFKKSMSMMRYDYGRYVDDSGNEISSVCILEADDSGTTFSENGSIYAIWAKGVKGCDPSETDDTVEESQIKESDVKAASSSPNSVRIWRTPQFTTWYNSGKMTDSGTISDIAHFESQCTTYSLVGGRWTSDNTCVLIPEEIQISNSSNARDSGGSLVLRFSASVTYNPEVLLMRNKHMLTVAPTGYSNVTDSYMQIEGMFKQKAFDCTEDDVNCSNTSNSSGETTNNSSNSTTSKTTDNSNNASKSTSTSK